MKVKDIMASPVTTCSIKSDVWEIRDLMNVKGYSSIPVVQLVDQEVKIKGIVSFRDLAGIDDDINIQQVMSNTVKVIDMNDSIKEAAKLMVANRLHHLVVMDKGKIVGMLSSFEFVKLTAAE
jgi:CBS domain-containing protein